MAIQNYVDNQINLVYQKQGQEGLILTENIYDKIVKQATSNKDVLQNGSIFKLICQYWVAPDNKKNQPVIKKKIDKTIVLAIKNIESP